MSTERFKNVTSFVINLLNNKTIILLNLAEYRLILADSASSAKYQTIFRAISQDNCYSLSRKIPGMFIVSRPIRCEMKPQKDNRQTAELIITTQSRLDTK